MNHKTLATALMTAGLLVTGPSFAADGFYAGAAIGNATLKDSGVGFSDTVNPYKLLIGYGFSDNLRIETAFVDFGTASQGNVDATIDGVAISLIGEIPVGNNFALFGRVGVYSWDAKIDVWMPIVQRFEDDGDDLLIGLGARYYLSRNLSLVGEIERYKIDFGRANVFSVGLNYSFGR